MPLINVPGYIKLNPTNAYNTMPIERINTFLNKMLMVFFCLVNPISSNENPKCIKNTSAVQIIIQTLLTVNSVFSIM